MVRAFKKNIPSKIGIQNLRKAFNITAVSIYESRGKSRRQFRIGINNTRIRNKPLARKVYSNRKNYF